MKKQLGNDSSIAAGFIIVAGLVLLAMTNGWFGLDKSTSWPAYIVLTGLAILAFLPKSKSPLERSLLAFLGAMPLLLGVFFFCFTLGAFTWSDMNKLWPTFVLITGLATLFSYAVGKSKQQILLYAGATLAVLAAIFLVLLQVTTFNLGALWPIFVIAIGVLLLSVPRLTRK